MGGVMVMPDDNGAVDPPQDKSDASGGRLRKGGKWLKDNSVASTVVGGLLVAAILGIVGLVYHNLHHGPPQAPVLSVDSLTVTNSLNAGGSEIVDLKVRNTGNEFADITQALIKVQQFITVPEFPGQPAFLIGVDYKYNVVMPLRPTARPISVLLNEGATTNGTKQVANFDLQFLLPKNASKIYVYRVDILLVYGGGKAPDNAGEVLLSLPADPVSECSSSPSLMKLCRNLLRLTGVRDLALQQLSP